MAHRQVDGIAAYNFPDALVGNPLFAWMGDDYVRFIAVELRRRFREQDAGSDLLAVKCESFPIIEVRTRDDETTVRGVVTVFDLQLLLRAADRRHWRLRGGGMFRAEELDRPEEVSVSVAFEVESSEEAA